MGLGSQLRWAAGDRGRVSDGPVAADTAGVSSMVLVTDVSCEWCIVTEVSRIWGTNNRAIWGTHNRAAWPRRQVLRVGRCYRTKKNGCAYVYISISIYIIYIDIDIDMTVGRC